MPCSLDANPKHLHPAEFMWVIKRKQHLLLVSTHLNNEKARLLRTTHFCFLPMVSWWLQLVFFYPKNAVWRGGSSRMVYLKEKNNLNHQLTICPLNFWLDTNVNVWERVFVALSVQTLPPGNHRKVSLRGPHCPPWRPCFNVDSVGGSGVRNTTLCW